MCTDASEWLLLNDHLSLYPVNFNLYKTMNVMFSNIFINYIWDLFDQPYTEHGKTPLNN